LTPLKPEHCCINCCDPKHSYAYITGAATITPYMPSLQPPHIFIREPHKVYDPARETGLLSMQKTFEERKVEYEHKKEWISGGCKSLRELFNLD